jgi:hypothetical protein
MSPAIPCPTARAHCPGGAARRDNSGSAAQGNARNYLLVAAKIDLAEQDARAIGRTFATSITSDRGGFDVKAVAAKIYAKSMIARRLKKSSGALAIQSFS